ncbi:hypothetical protein [uncultured Paraglaciecola sp.]|uniref:hypothetical protein n=1 Tax=uncultured Paraglaciecola sp. TaxID=1765024 RepID=UPI00262376D1|nr:hypothetical protein [uncultured Paraglaciecola sp.]
MTKDEKEAMRDGFNLCLTKIEQQKIVIGTLISWLARELGEHNVKALIADLEKEVKTKDVWERN